MNRGGFPRASGGARVAAWTAVLTAILIAAVPAAAAAKHFARHAAGEPSPWTWEDRGPKLLSVSCPTQGKCVAVGVGGAVLRSPGGGTTPLAWSRVSGLADDEDLVSVACRGPLCIAVTGIDLHPTSAISKVSRSTDGGATWSRPEQLPAATTVKSVKKHGRTVKTKVATRVADAIACEPTGACVIVGRGGGIWRSTDQGQSWKPVAGGSTPTPYFAVACPTDGVCLLVGGNTGAGKTTVLKGTTAAAVAAPAIGQLRAVACDTSSSCTAGGDKGSVASISAPWQRWDSPVRLPGDTAVVSLSCPAANTCVGATGATMVRTVNRSGGEWAKRPTGTVGLTSVSCAGASCAVVGDAAAWYGSTSTGFAWGQVNQVSKLDVVTCLSGAGSGTCLGGGMSDIGRSTTSGDLWTTPLSVTSLSAAGVSCAGFPTCFVISKDKTLVSMDRGVTWHFRQAAGSITAGPEKGTCFDAMKCVAVSGGNVYTTFDGAQTGWDVGGIATGAGEMVGGLSCPTSTTCLMATKSYIWRGDMTLTDGVVNWSWVAGDADPSDPLTGIGCSSTSSCTAVGQKGQVWVSTDATLLHWTLKKIGPATDPAPLLGVACPANGVCVAVGFRGYVATTTNNWASWSVGQIGAVRAGANPPDIKGVGCQSATRCLLVGDTAYVGSR
ncbi:MAG TPA: hypothetical protein VGF81_06580 [Solirubrobacteraceae bacterium]